MKKIIVRCPCGSVYRVEVETDQKENLKVAHYEHISCGVGKVETDSAYGYPRFDLGKKIRVRWGPFWDLKWPL